MTRVSEIWRRYQGTIMGHRVVLEQAVASLFGDGLSETLRKTAQRESDKLASLIGAHGFTAAARLAREMAEVFGGGAAVCRAQSGRLVELVTALRRELERIPEIQARVDRRGVLQLLIVDHNAALAEALALEAMRTGIAAEVAYTLAQAETVVATTPPRLALIDLFFPDGTAGPLALLHKLATRVPAIPAFALSASDTQGDRLLVARAGGQGFLRKSMGTEQIIGRVRLLLEQWHGVTQAPVLSEAPPRQGPPPLPMFLLTTDGLLREGLEQAAAERHVHLRSQAVLAGFWEELSGADPSLLWLDAESRFEGAGTADLCRLVRNEARWLDLPLLVLAAQPRPEQVEEWLQAGADLVLARQQTPALSLLMALQLLRRQRITRRIAHLDATSGTLSRAGAEPLFEHLQHINARQNHPWCVVVLGVDQLARIAEEEGTGAVEVLHFRLGQLLLRTFRREDLVARWYPDSFVVGLHNIDRERATQRLGLLFKQVGLVTFPEPAWANCRITLSAGIAQAPLNGESWRSLEQVARLSFLEARRAGGNQIVKSGEEAQPNLALDRVDLVLIDDDAKIDSAILQALRQEGWSCQWFRSAATAQSALTGTERTLATSLVLLASSLPDAKGFDLYRRLQKDVLIRNFIVLSDAPSQDEVLEALQLGALEYLTKPVNLTALVERIRRILESSTS